MSCGHEFCRACWEGYRSVGFFLCVCVNIPARFVVLNIYALASLCVFLRFLNVKIQEGDAHNIFCPAYECYQLVPVHVIESVVSREMDQRYLQFDIKVNANRYWLCVCASCVFACCICIRHFLCFCLFPSCFLFSFISSFFYFPITSTFVFCSSLSTSVSVIYPCPLFPFLSQAFVENNPAIRWCPAARCERAVRLTRPGPGDSDPQSFPLLPSPAVDCGKGHLFCWYT